MKDPILTQELILWDLLTNWFVNIDTPKSRLGCFSILTIHSIHHFRIYYKITPRVEIKGCFWSINNVNSELHGWSGTKGVISAFFPGFLNSTLTFMILIFVFEPQTPIFPVFFISYFFSYDTTNKHTKTIFINYYFYIIRNEGVCVRSERSEDSQWERSIL